MLLTASEFLAKHPLDESFLYDLMPPEKTYCTEREFWQIIADHAAKMVDS